MGTISFEKAQRLEVIFADLSNLKNRSFNGIKVLVFYYAAQKFNESRIAASVANQSIRHGEIIIDSVYEILNDFVRIGLLEYSGRKRGVRTYTLTDDGRVLYKFIKRYLQSS